MELVSHENSLGTLKKRAFAMSALLTVMLMQDL